MPVIYIRKQLLFDEAGNVVDFIFCDVNNLFEKVFHCTRDRVVGKRLTEADVDNQLLDYMMDKESKRITSFLLFFRKKIMKFVITINYLSRVPRRILWMCSLSIGRKNIWFP